ncbi:hypothetical protein COL154_006603 [Colletotrichum chrysophilum]|nr:uncharacterized protein COL26b_006150 [Colletotrichum chrysophilum]KAJ0352391.1 hypothetical protein KNSL1_002661 [Colletotrichum chrysophilum]KAJ0361867.1 hypothetical protein COL154_006603 [Colletotrichum chrysophilum]KAJ0375644.1 hypothetical protein COL26b_006150 [Colletotrichum chrysophilum]
MGHRQNVCKTRYVSTVDTALRRLETAREDLINGIAAKNLSSGRLDAVGGEYIAAMAMANVQTGAFRISAGPQVPIHKAQAQTMSLDLIAFYTAHLNALDFKTNQHPHRRAFVAIRALEEELQALRYLNITQWHCLDNSKRVSDPTSFRVVDRERNARFSLEKKAVERAKADRRREGNELLTMLHRAGDLRAKVKESIEVLDEGHWNVLRVFTLYTLLFLPL